MSRDGRRLQERYPEPEADRWAYDLDPASDLAPEALQGVTASRFCDGCGRRFTPRRRKQRHCGPSCRVKAFRRRQHANAKLADGSRVTDRALLVESDGSEVGPHHRRDDRMDTRQQDISRGYCRGCASPGEAPWCRLCRWSPTYWRDATAGPNLENRQRGG